MLYFREKIYNNDVGPGNITDSEKNRFNKDSDVSETLLCGKENVIMCSHMEEQV